MKVKKEEIFSKISRVKAEKIKKNKICTHLNYKIEYEPNHYDHSVNIEERTGVGVKPSKIAFFNCNDCDYRIATNLVDVSSGEVEPENELNKGKE